MLRHHIGIECGRVAADFDLKIARGMSSVERTEKRQQSIHDGLATSQLGKLDPSLLPAGWKSRVQFSVNAEASDCITVVETEGVAMNGVRNLITIASLFNRSVPICGSLISRHRRRKVYSLNPDRDVTGPAGLEQRRAGTPRG